nr:MAG TPA: hypothetical protein [Caudoviricetes sp.]
MLPLFPHFPLIVFLPEKVYTRHNQIIKRNGYEYK